MAKSDRGRAIRAIAMARRGAAGAIAVAVVIAGAPAAAACETGEATSSFAEARRAFEEKRFDDAVTLLRRAYACDKNPVYLANVARAYEEASRPKDALTAWGAYLEVVVDVQERRRTEGRISALSKVVANLERLERERREADDARRRAEEEARRRSGERAEEEPRKTPPSAPSIAPGAWVTSGVGAAGVLAGVIFGLLANARHSAAITEPGVTRAEDLQGQARSWATASTVSFIAGGAVTAIGLTWIGIDLFRSAARDAPPVQARIVASPSGVSIAGGF